MLDFLLRNQDAIILAVFFMIAGFPVGKLFTHLLGRQEAVPAASVRIGPIIEVPVPQPRHAARHAGPPHSNDDWMPLSYIVIAVACFGYLYWHGQVLLTIVSFVSFSIGMFFGTTLYAYKIDAIDGSGWTLYLIFTFCIGVLSFVLVDFAQRPIHAPQAFESYPAALRQMRTVEFLRWVGIRNLTWLITHVFGVFVLLYVQVRLVLSLVHYLCMLRLAVSGPSAIPRKLAVATRKYAKPIKNCFTLTALSIVSFLLINGYAFIWYEQLFQAGRSL